MRIFVTLLNPDTGKVYINGKDISNYTAEAKRSIGYLPDHDMHDPWLTGWENLVLRAEFLNIKRSEIKKPTFRNYRIVQSPLIWAFLWLVVTGTMS